MTEKPLSKRPQTSRPKPAMINHGHTKDSDETTYKPYLDNNPNDTNSVSSRTNNNNNNFDVIESVISEKQKANYEMLLQEEADRITQIKLKKDQLDDLDLIEKDIGDLYDWKTLFNNSRPLSSYTKLNVENKLNKDEGDINSFKFPLALIDAPEEKVAQFIPNLMIEQPQVRPTHKTKLNKSNSHNDLNDNDFITAVGLKPRIGNATRPQSVYSARNKNDSFYLSKAFSDYYNEDLKGFCKKIPLLEAKIQVDHKKFNRTVKNIKRKITEKEMRFGYEMNKEEEVHLSPRLLKYAGAKNLCEPLLRSIYQQIHPECNDNDYNNNETGNRRTTKSAQNDDITQILMSSSYKNSNHASMRGGLFLPTYDENDPQLLIFSKIKEEDDHQSSIHSQRSKEDEVEAEMTKLHQEYQRELHQGNRAKIRPLTGIPASAKIKRIFSAAPSKNKKPIITSRPQTSFPYQPPTPYKYDLNSSASVNNLNTRPTTAVMDYIPTKAMPLKRNNSAIGNKLYQQINTNLKNRIKKNLNKDAFEDIENIKPNSAITYNDTKNEVSCLIKTRLRPSSAVTPPMELVSKYNFPAQRNELHQLQTKDFMMSNVNLNEEIRTKFITAEDSKKGGMFGKYHQNAHDINYYRTHYFNKGTSATSFNGIKRASNQSNMFNSTYNNNMSDLNSKKQKMAWRNSIEKN